MGTEGLSNEEIVEFYRQDALKLIRYLPWLETKQGENTYQSYGADGIAQHSIAFPVYDGTLMSFVKEAQNTCFMNRNYVYVYSRNGLKNAKDEIRLIHTAEIRDMDKLAGILSHYILGGRTKGLLWSEGVKNGVFLALLTKMRDLITFWDSNTVKEFQSR